MSLRQGRPALWALVLGGIGTAACWAIFAFTLMMVYTNLFFVKAAVGGVTGVILGAFAGLFQWLALRNRSTQWRWIGGKALAWGFAGVAAGMVALLTPSDVELGVEYVLGIALGGAAAALLQIVNYELG